MMELSRLPPYCRGTTVINQMMGAEGKELHLHYKRIIGPTYSHLHHYCWALNAENKAATMFDNPMYQRTLLITAIKDIDYVLKYAEPGF
ncbi:MAG: hypothetical protein MZV65_22290 [Chromatiales bacterium]|nr:hypothetical protein [Chromatiales bacterium]